MISLAFRPQDTMRFVAQAHVADGPIFERKWMDAEKNCVLFQSLTSFVRKDWAQVTRNFRSIASRYNTELFHAEGTYDPNHGAPTTREKTSTLSSLSQIATWVTAGPIIKWVAKVVA